MNADQRTSGEIPVYIESLGGSLIDSARISVMAALAMLPPPVAPLIVLPGSEQQMAEDSASSVHGCLEQAMEWLDAARVRAMGELAAKGVPPTSLHAIDAAFVTSSSPETAGADASTDVRA